MRVLGIEKVNDFCRHNMEARQDVSALIRDLELHSFASPSELSARYPSARVLNGKVVVFKIRGNRFRLVARFAYNTGTVVVDFVGTHKQYDRLDLR
jgi:mRNA interferase HigB